jgi:spermidine synthase
LKHHRSFSIALHLLNGLSIALLASLLIYFKQKPVLHHFAILASTASIYFTFYVFGKKVKSLPAYLSIVALIVFTINCWLAPQLNYQVRPYTFYFSGFVMASVALFVLSANIIDFRKGTSLLVNLSIFSGAYLTGLFIEPTILQYVIAGLLLVILIGFALSGKDRTRTGIIFGGTYLLCLLAFWRFSIPVRYFEVQKEYEDKVLFSAKTQFHNLVITQWNKDHWFYIDKLKNISSIDEYLYYEPMVHSVFSISDNIGQVLIIGGENGCLVREVLKYDQVSDVHIVSYDTLLRNLAMENRYFTDMNNGAYNDPSVRVIHENLLEFVSDSTKKYDAVFVDLPDPRSIEANQYYTLEFYSMLKELLQDGGLMCTQAGSPYFATEAFYSIGQTIQTVGFHALPIHNQVLTLGEWGWYVCSSELMEEEIKSAILNAGEVPVPTKWWNPEAALLVTSFGKTYSDTLNIQVNSLENPLVYQYYLKGNWDMNQ